MNFEQRANIKFCLKLGKTFTETFELMKQVYGDNCLYCAWIYLKNEPKSSLRHMAMELNMSKDSIHRILTEKLESNKDPNFKYSIVTGDETWCFEYDPETKRQSAEWKHPSEPDPKKSRREKSKVKTHLICFYDSKEIIHKEFVPQGQVINEPYYLGVMKRLLSRIRRVGPQYRENGSWRLLHNNAPAHRSTLITDFLTKSHILTVNDSPYSPDLALCDFFLFGQLHLAMKGKRHADIETIQKASTAILNNIPTERLKNSFDMLINHAKRCIDAQGDYFE